MSARKTTVATTAPPAAAEAPVGRGGAGRGQGRKPVEPELKMVPGSIRLNAAQWEKFERLGGATWLRARIDRAKG